MRMTLVKPKQHIQIKINPFKRLLFAVLVILSVFFFFIGGFFESSTAAAANDNDNSSAVEDLSGAVGEMVGGLDVSAIDEFINSLSQRQREVFGAASITERIQRIASGDAGADYSSFFAYLLELGGASVIGFLPFIFSILVICIAFNIMSSIKGRLASNSVESIVHFATLSLVVVIVLSEAAILITSTVKTIAALQKQMNIIFPIILTMMAATGATGSTAVYQPAVAVLSGGVLEIITALILPCFILSVVFTVVGSISKGVKLKKMSDFFMSSSKWLLGTVFFVFIAFLSIQGITASVSDGVSVRTAKFAISKYVPIIGGYLSEGFNLVMAGSVIVKNAVGMSAVILLFVSVAPLIIEIILFSLCLSLTGAIVEPLGNSEISSLLTNLSKNMGMLIASVAAVVFLYFIFLLLCVSTGNLSL